MLGGVPEGPAWPAGTGATGAGPRGPSAGGPGASGSLSSAPPCSDESACGAEPARDGAFAGRAVTRRLGWATPWNQGGNPSGVGPGVTAVTRRLGAGPGEDPW